MKRLFIYASLFILALNVSSLHALVSVPSGDLRSDRIDNFSSGKGTSPANHCSTVVTAYQEATTTGGYAPLDCTEFNPNPENMHFKSKSLISASYDVQCQDGSDVDDYGNISYWAMWDVYVNESWNCNFECNQIKTNDQCQIELGRDEAYYSEDICDCAVPCSAPEDSIMIRAYSYLGECQEDLSSSVDGAYCFECNGNVGMYVHEIPQCGENATWNIDHCTCDSGWYPSNPDQDGFECLPMDCEDYAQHSSASCDTSTNDHYFECIEDMITGVPNVTRDECIPKLDDNNDTIPPEDNNHTNPDYPADCTDTQTYNYNTQKCEDNPEDPTLPEDNNETDPQDPEDPTLPEDDNDGSLDSNTTNPDNNTPDDGDSGDSNSTDPFAPFLDDNFEGFDEDEDLEEAFDSYTKVLDEAKQGWEDFKSNFDTQYVKIGSEFDRAKAIFQGEKSFSPLPRGNASNCLTFVFFGKTIIIDFCGFMSQFAPIFYFMITTSISILIVIFGFKYIIRGFY